ncbi:hypothetical protein GMST_14290 [Geomonas silvestris]|uniref:Three-Cys-motif partner protein TcmP n=1 Tax=Geomonas silvestris TaxID=2740184 RepID=A0A6V8MGR6_9BACT|nr:three-Cys-motif partner protein TcmP [Geomonas silvestris]GFO59104.1 hypothetical protein GMST_14290 [Geomonas silvestris]
MANLQEFGGDWTQEKLFRVRSYLSAYTQALKNKNFNLVYIDAFAGTGYRNLKIDETSTDLLFPDQAGHDAEALHAGSARIALEMEPPFSWYYFIEQDKEKCGELERLRTEFPDKARQIRIINDDANATLQKISLVQWKQKNLRGVLFLDPFGMNVSWNTIEAVARTEAIDMWYLFPLGVGVNRLLRKDGNIPEGWRRRLENIFGNSDWEGLFYKKEVLPNLFGEEEIVSKTGDFKQITDYFVTRLQTIFPGVAGNPLQLMNSRSNPLYLLCFAASNKKGAPIALKIAEHILRGRRP